MRDSYIARATRLVIERPEILDRPAAAPCDYKVCNVKLIRVAYRADDLRRWLQRPARAHGSSTTFVSGQRRPRMRIMSCTAAPADEVDDGDALRKLGQRLFMRAVKQSLFRQLCL